MKRTPKETARIEALNALDRLLRAGRVDDKIELIKGRGDKVHVKTYFKDRRQPHDQPMKTP